jgi:hypothetical protein
MAGSELLKLSPFLHILALAWDPHSTPQDRRKKPGALEGIARSSNKKIKKTEKK